VDPTDGVKLNAVARRAADDEIAVHVLTSSRSTRTTDSPSLQPDLRSELHLLQALHRRGKRYRHTVEAQGQKLETGKPLAPPLSARSCGRTTAPILTGLVQTTPPSPIPHQPAMGRLAATLSALALDQPNRRCRSGPNSRAIVGSKHIRSAMSRKESLSRRWAAASRSVTAETSAAVSDANLPTAARSPPRRNREAVRRS